jgi:hypothetical protein
MKKMTDIMLEQSAALDKESQQKIVKLVKKIGTFSHCPLNAKHAQRMEPFADAVTVPFISSLLLETPVPQSGDIYFTNIIAYYYCIALISFSESIEAKHALGLIIDTMIAMNYEDMYLVKRNFGFFKNRPDLDYLRIKAELYISSKEDLNKL